jgi:hypothetical protein
MINTLILGQQLVIYYGMRQQSFGISFLNIKDLNDQYGQKVGLQGSKKGTQ